MLDHADLRKHRLITGLLLIHRVKLVCWREETKHEQEKGEHSNDNSECPLRSRHFGFFKKRHTVADGFNTSHRGAAAGERAQQNPRARCFGRAGNWWKRLNRLRMAAD